jgi:hypothetical protein
MKRADVSYHLHLLRNYHKELGGILQPIFVSPWIPDEKSNPPTKTMTTVPNLAFVQRRTSDIVSSSPSRAKLRIVSTDNGSLGNGRAFSKSKFKLEEQGHRVGRESEGWI